MDFLFVRLKSCWNVFNDRRGETRQVGLIIIKFNTLSDHSHIIEIVVLFRFGIGYPPERRRNFYEISYVIELLQVVYGCLCCWEKFERVEVYSIHMVC